MYSVASKPPSLPASKKQCRLVRRLEVDDDTTAAMCFSEPECEEKCQLVDDVQCQTRSSQECRTVNEQKCSQVQEQVSS